MIVQTGRSPAAAFPTLLQDESPQQGPGPTPRHLLSHPRAHAAMRFPSPMAFIMTIQGSPSCQLPGDKDKIMYTPLTCLQLGSESALPFKQEG